MRKRHGFTIIELLVVITIFGILMGLVVATVQPVQMRSRDAKRKADINLMLASLNQFHLDYKIFPNYTYVLGRSTLPGEQESYYDLGADLATCANFGVNTPGHPRFFTKQKTEPIGATTVPPAAFGASDFNNYVLRPGFSSVNHFLICLKYIDRIIVDPRPLNDFNDYQYQVSYDYQNILVSSRIENANDPASISRLFENGATLNPKRYFEGNGRFVWQFDELTDGPTAPNGRYFYQCHFRDATNIIPRDDRALNRFQPFISDPTTLNNQCRQQRTADETVPKN